jgi:hypothetical protein
VVPNRRGTYLAMETIVLSLPVFLIDEELRGSFVLIFVIVVTSKK